MVPRPPRNLRVIGKSCDQVSVETPAASISLYLESQIFSSVGFTVATRAHLRFRARCRRELSRPLLETYPGRSLNRFVQGAGGKGRLPPSNTSFNICPWPEIGPVHQDCLRAKDCPRYLIARHVAEAGTRTSRCFIADQCAT